MLVRDVSFEVRRGEVLGLAGLAGSGASEALGAVFGRLPRAGGRVRVDGKPVPSGRPAAALRQGLAFLTNDRKAEGLTLSRSVVENVTLASLPRFSPGGWLRPRREERAVRNLARELDLQAPSLAAPVSTLSGGNQQKALLARLWLTEPAVLLLDEPTRGVDVAAKARIHRLIDEWSRAGCALVADHLRAARAPGPLRPGPRAPPRGGARRAREARGQRREGDRRGARGSGVMKGSGTLSAPLRALLALALVFAVGLVFHADGAFYRWDTHRAMLRQASVHGILACGMTLVIVTAGIDLAVGSVLALAAVLFAS